jgi:uncharacterized protein (DUF433 family)
LKLEGFGFKFQPEDDGLKTAMSATHPLITQNSKIMAGKPCIRDTRIPVDFLVRKLSPGETRERLLADYPQLDDADLDAALSFSKDG